MRKLAVAAAVSLALASGGAKALILGEINMRSALNQPMNAEIGLSSVESGELEGMIVKLASPEAFARAGIERTQALNDLKFTVVSGSGGQPVIRISSDKPVLEPFLNFLLEVDWTRGRMVREYTVLLDPPVFMTPTAQPRSTVGDTPVLVDSATEDSILNPVAIDRGDAAAPFDESSVVIVGDTGEVSDAQDGVAVDLGEVVDLGDVVELGGVAEVADGVTADSSVVSLDGLELEAGSTNDQAVSLTDPNAGQDSFTANADWEVAVLGDTAEVGDDVGAPISIDRVAVDTDSAASETVSLDELAPAGDAFVASTQSNAQPGSSVTVQQNDTLWEIATANKLQGMTTQQMMLALLEANEQAFINGNINLVKAGAILRIPESNAVTSLSQSEAVAQVGVQEQLWREYRDNLRGASGASGDAQIAQNDAAAGNTGADAAAADAAAADAAAADADSATTVADAGDSAATATGADSQGAGATAGTDTDAAANAETVAANVSDAATGATQQPTNELKIVASEQPSTTVASLNADESESPEAARLGEINLKLKLAREELAAARLEADELTEQDSELESMTENMDQLVTMRQTQLAKLQAQLDAARADADAAGSGDAAATIADAAAAGAVSDAGDSATDTVANAADAVADAGSDATAAASDAAESAVAAVTADGTDATATDNQSATLVDTDSAAAASAAAAATAAAQPWYKQWLADPKVLGLGVGGLALGGLLFALLRRRRSDDGEEDIDEVVFLDGDETQAEVEESEDLSPAAMVEKAESHVAATATDVASEEGSEPEFDQEQTVALGAATDEGNETQADQTSSKDDTVSEAEVYLAYGLHGQAEDLLKKAIEKNPDNPEYQAKLLHTYHVQNKTGDFDSLAAEYHQNFGGQSSPQWQSLADLGKELSPSNELYLGSSDSVESVGRGEIDAPKLDFDDFSSADAVDDGVSSQVREFSSSDVEAVDMDEGADHSAMLDQTIDPASAFDESDLEATGDFTQLSNELNGDATGDAGAKDDDGGLEFPTEFGSELASDASDAVSDGAQKLKAVGVSAAGAAASAASGANDDSIDFESDLSALGDATANTGGIELNADALDGVQPEAATSAEDLSLDLDRLEGELDLDSTEMLDGGLDMTQDLEIPDLTGGGDLTTDASAAFGNVDEMDTMMDLAKAYIDMGDNDSASSALGEIVKSGSPEQKTEAENLLRKIS